jgi:hypothetical protein
MTEYLPDGSTILRLIHKWAKPPTKKAKKRPECYTRLMRLLYGHYDEYEQWMKDPELLKQMQMNVGHFIQDLIGNMKGHSNFHEGHPTGLDGESTLHGTHIVYEVKVDDFTTNSSSLQECVNKLQKVSCTKALLIQFFRMRKVVPGTKHSQYIIDGDEYLNTYVSPEIGGVDGFLSELERNVFVHRLVSTLFLKF